ncbi:MAG: Glucuronide carrier protein [Firmicutes bacterium ADurb.Bin300]|nr:MAG: Glucuronide carrier protein [Firmicutes bacterium ADurb.Bin300]
MSEVDKSAVTAEDKNTTVLSNPKSIVYRNRRYVGTKETLAYILYDVSASFNIGKYSTRYIYDVILIDFKYLVILNLFGGIWDIINDTFIGVIVDRTRTRYGKFRPYLLFLVPPLTIVGMLYWFIPVFFPDTSALYLPKFIFYFILSVVQETAGTFTGMASGGLLATITPHPIDRTRLITSAQLLSGLFGEKVPELLMGLFIDLINHKIVNWSFRNLYMTMGIFTAVVSSSLAIFFFIMSKERVMQSIEKPSIKMGLKSILNNKPLLLITLSSFLSSFAVSNSRSDYYIDVLGTASVTTIVGIPGALVSPSSYAFVPWARKRFSTKAIWVFEDIWTDMCWLFVFVVGLINKNYQKFWVMVPVITIEETLEMMVYGLRKVVPTEMNNEAMDYCEWKNGYRTEAMTGVARSLILKLQGVFMSMIKNIVLGKIGYVQGLEIGTQKEKTKLWMFMLCTGVPVITGALGVVPKLFYNLTGEKRDKMYEELFERRERLAEETKNATAEEMKRIGRAQMEGKYLSDTKL